MRQNKQLNFDVDNLAIATFSILLLLKLGFSFQIIEMVYHVITNELSTTALIETGQLACVDENLLCQFYKDLPSFLPRLESVFMKISAGSENLFLIFFMLLGQVSYALGCYILGKKITSSSWGGVLLYVFGMMASLRDATYGYGYINWYSVVAPGLIFQGVGTLILAFIFQRKKWLAAICCGILANFHPVIAFILSAFLFLFVVLEGEKKKNIIILCGMIFFAALPNIYNILSVVIADKPGGALVAEWWSLMVLIKSHHMFPWDSLNQNVRFLGAVLIFVILLRTSWRSLTKSSKSFFISIVSVVIGLSLFTYLGTELIRSPTIAAAMLSRSSVFLIPPLLMLVVKFFLDAFDKEEGFNVWIIFITTVLIFLLIPDRFFSPLHQFFWLSYFLILFSLWRDKLKPLSMIVGVVGLTPLLILMKKGHVDSFYWAEKYLFLTFILIAVVFLVYIVTKKTAPHLCRINNSFKKIIFLFVIIWASGFHFMAWQRHFVAYLNESSLPDYLNAASWIGYKAPKGSAILVPPNYVKFEAASRRVPYGDLIQPGLSMYALSYFKQDLEQLNVLYDLVDFKSPETQNRIRTQGFTSLIYEKFYSYSEEKVLKIKAKYPSIGYVMRHKAKEARRLDFPVIFENSSFVIYSLISK